MELFEDKKKLKAYASAGLVALFLVFIGLMIYEYMHFDKKWTILEAYDFLKQTDYWLILTGDRTLHHFRCTALSVKVYFLIYTLGGYVAYKLYKYFKDKVFLFVLVTWSTLFTILFVSTMMYTSSDYELALRPYYDMFVTLQFLKTDITSIKVVLLILMAIFVAINIYLAKRTMTFLKDVKVKEQVVLCDEK